MAGTMEQGGTGLCNTKKEPQETKEMRKKARNWVFTYYWNTEQEITDLKILLTAGCEYFIFGREVCPKTKRNHLQGFCLWKNPRSFRSVLAFLKEFKGIHVEKAKKCDLANYRYCSKDKVIEEWPKDFLKNPEPEQKVSDKDLRDQIREELMWDNLTVAQKRAWHKACERAIAAGGIEI